MGSPADVTIALTFLCGIFTEAVPLTGCLLSLPFHSWPWSEMKTKLIPRGLSIFLPYKLLVLLSRRSPQSAIYNSFQQAWLPRLSHDMEKAQIPPAEPCPLLSLAAPALGVGDGGGLQRGEPAASQREMRTLPQGGFMGMPKGRATLSPSPHIFLSFSLIFP